MYSTPTDTFFQLNLRCFTFYPSWVFSDFSLNTDYTQKNLGLVLFQPIRQFTFAQRGKQWCCGGDSIRPADHCEFPTPPGQVH